MKRLLFVFGPLTVALGASWACSFPDVTFGPAEDLEAGVEAGAEVDADPQPVADAGSDALEEQDSGPILIDGSTVEELVVVDAGGKVDAAGCMSCDCDGDHYNDLTKPGCEDAPGPHDCDDNDSRVHPRQGFLFDRAESPRNGDWDCSGKVEKLWTNEKATCAGLTLGLGCSDIYGFTSPVACGERGSWLRCKRRSGLLALDCIVDEQKLETQLCK
ncbi:MAG: hypothetical protein BGO98_18875 [Myxococcales bacterium 68-20]|nr:hypothetical protein [Myxococcales bacterium]OJY24699.1 MAG: hypothetical protein BGO98_18875 [Myxococcales bacterium 68-20]